MINENFIWAHTQEAQICKKTEFDDGVDWNFKVYRFKKEYNFGKAIKKLRLDIFADTKYFLYINGNFAGFGPICAGGDYGSSLTMPIQYYDSYDLDLNGQRLEFEVLVQQDIVVQTDMSVGICGLTLSGEVIFDDGDNESIKTDTSWRVCEDKRFPAINSYNYSKEDNDYNLAVKQASVWNLRPSEIPLLKRTKVKTDFIPFTVDANSEKAVSITADKIYSVFLGIKINGDSEYEITADMSEDGERVLQSQHIVGCGSANHLSLVMASASNLKLTVKNKGNKALKIEDVYFDYVRYPEDNTGSFVCSDEVLNKIYNVGRHTLEICRQSIHLDSPAHQETMGCSGDYFIQSLIEYYIHADTGLTRFDIIRISDYLKMSKGYMFHTSYSLIWVEMVWEYYLHTADMDTLHYAFGAIECVINKMKSCADENGIIQNPESYMFIDWTWRGEHNLHHPPKAMGQGPLNAFYYGALSFAQKIACELENAEKAEEYAKLMQSVKIHFNELFFDNERCQYFDGLNDATENVSRFMPANVEGRFYSKYTNTLAVLYGLCEGDKAVTVLEKALYTEGYSDVQPYFMHYILQALYKCGLFDKYGLSEIRKWEAAVNECDKGMKEAWIIFEGYGFDYSHAWGASPSYHLPDKILGLEILKAGMGKIKLKPQLYGLQNAKITFPTPQGTVEVSLERGKEPSITASKGIEIVLNT